MQIPDERYSCQSCGRCCTRWTITVDEARVTELRRHAWGSDPFVRRRGEGDAYRIRMVNGRCFFLDEAQRCRIHRELGYDAKPEGCKAFPLHVAQVAGQTHLRLSFYCPTVTRGEGRPLKEQRRWIKAVVKAGGASRSEPLRLDADVEISLCELEAIEDLLSRLLQRADASVGDRLAAGGAVLQRLQQAAAASGKAGLKPALEQAEQQELAALAAEGRAGGSAAQAGTVLSLFLGQDCQPGGGHRLGHFFRVRLFQLGLARYRSWLLGARASRKALAAVDFAPSPSAEALCGRYLLHKLQARRTLMADDQTLISGFNLLVAAFSVVNLLARLRVASEGRARCSDEDIAQAIQAADLLVVEHTTLNQGSLLATLTGTVLQQPHLCASLLARLEGGRDG